MVKRLLHRDPGIHLNLIEMAEIFLIQPVQLFFHIHISIQVNIAVSGMVIGLVERQELFVGQFRNMLRVTAGFIGVRRVREKGI